MKRGAAGRGGASSRLSFANILGEFSRDEFLSRVWGRSFAHLGGTRGRFRSLVSWPEVNTVLQRHRLEPPRLRLARNGTFAPKNSFLRYESAVPFVVPEKLSAQLRDGYTLIIDAVDDMLDGVMRLAEDFERALHEPVQVNLYAGWCEQQGFNRHCDTHDVVVLQVYGRKYWRVYQGGRPHPLKNDIAANQEPPDTVLWEGTLEEGEAIYIPRGWWHEASGAGEVTLHLTFGIHQRTGISLMQWLTDQLRASTDFRAPLLRFGSSEEKQRQLAELKRQVVDAFDEDLLHRYFAHLDARARPRGWASLPWTVDSMQKPSMSALVAISTPRMLDLVREDGVIRFEANGRAWRVAADAEPVLHVLAQGPSTVEQLCHAAAGTLDRIAVQQFVAELAREGLVLIAGEPEA